MHNLRARTCRKLRWRIKTLNDRVIARDRRHRRDRNAKSDFAGLLPETQKSFKMTVSDPNEASCRTRKQQGLLSSVACADLDLGVLGFARPPYGQPLCSW